MTYRYLNVGLEHVQPSSERCRPPALHDGAKTKRPTLGRREALRRCPIGTNVAKPNDEEHIELVALGRSTI